MVSKVAHIKDQYFRDKLEKGYIAYEPSLWEETSRIASLDKELDKFIHVTLSTYEKITEIKGDK